MRKIASEILKKILVSESVQDLERKLFHARLDTCADLESRFAFIVSFGKDTRGYWSRLESETGISAQRCLKPVADRQRPTPDMI